MTDQRLEMRRGSSEGSGWTIRVEDGVLSVSGGSHNEAYGDVSTPLAAVDQLVSDIRLMAQMAEGRGRAHLP